MHIAIDAQPFLRQEDGIGRYCKELFSELLKTTDHTYELVGFRDQKELPRLLPMSDRVSYTFLPMPRKMYSIAFKNGFKFSVNRWLKKRPDAVIYPNFVDTPYIANTPSYLIVHDAAFIDRPETVNERNQRYLERSVPIAITKAHKVLTISKFSAKRLSELFRLDLGSIGLLQPGINPDHFNGKVNKNILKKYDLKKGYILAVGTIEPRKNYGALIEAYMLLPKATRDKHQLVLAGRPGWKTEELNARINSLREQGENIIVTGFFDDEDLPSLYSLAEVFVQPSSYEGFGIPPLEAMASKTPIVTSNLSALEESVGDAAEIIDPNDPDSISAGLKRVLSDKDYRDKLVLRGTRQVAKFTWKKSARNLAKLLSELET